MSIKKLPDGRYEWRHRVGGRHLKKTFDRRADAVAHDSRIRADLARGVHVDLSNKVTVAEYARQWSEQRVMRPRSRQMHETFLRHDVTGTLLGARPVVRVRPSEIQAWVTARSAVLGPVTLRMRLSLLRSVFAAAVLDGVIAKSPVLPNSRLSLPRDDRAKFVPLTVEQVRAWADAARPRLRGMILVQAALGLRISELRGLRVQDVDFLRREVRIDEQLDATGTRRVPLKTATSRRVVPLPQVAAEVLAAHIAQFPPGDDGLIFTGAHGHGWASGGWLWRRYRESAAAAGLPEGTMSHDLRHHYASVLLAGGESVHAVAERLGDTAQMALTVYGHVMPDREETTRRVVDAAWADADRSERSAR
jgi:integrase